jgi:hypothetical protein
VSRSLRARSFAFACCVGAAALGTPSFAEEMAGPNPPRIEGPLQAPPADRPLPRGAGTTLWALHESADGQHPNGEEQELLWLQNRARQDPTAEGIWLATTTEPDVAGGRDFFNVNLTMLQDEFAALPARPPVAFDRRLWEAAHAHNLDELIAQPAPQTNQTHDDQDTRVEDAGFDYVALSMSVFGFADSALNAHAALNIDWGPGPGNMQPDRGHRDGIMGNYDNAGLAFDPDDPNVPVANSFGPLVFSGDYARADALAPNHHRRFLVGTVWDDANENDRYDDGEGFPDVLVQPSTGSFHAITSPGGGFAIPILAPGTYQVTFSGAGIDTAVFEVPVGADSALLDYPIHAPEPGQAALLATGAAVLVLARRRRA